jgi:hypothetical protein
LALGAFAILACPLDHVDLRSNLSSGLPVRTASAAMDFGFHSPGSELPFQGKIRATMP